MELSVRESLHWLEGIEDGTMTTGDLYNLSTKLDPVLINMIIKYIRKKYPSTKPEAAGVIGRLVELTNTYPDIVKKMKSAETDPIVEWFSESYNFGEFYSKPEEMLEMLVDKLES